MSKLYRFLSFYYVFLFGFPLYLMAFEYILMVFQGVSTGQLLGVTLASSGMAFIAEGFKHRHVVVDPGLSSHMVPFFADPNFAVRYKYDEIIFRISIVCLLICLLIWYYTCSLSLSMWTTADLPTEEMEIIKEKAMFFGCVNYLTGMVIAILKA